MTDVGTKCSHKSRHILLLTNAKGSPLWGVFKSKFLECEQTYHLANDNENVLVTVM